MVVERGGVQEAAYALHIGQPAISKRLKVLEQVYGLALFEKVGQKLRLTAAGQKLYVLAVQTLDRHSSLQEEFANLTRGQDMLRLCVTFGIAEHFLSNLLLIFSQRHPAYKIQSRLAYSREIQTNLATGIADLGLLESAPEHPDILVQKWLDDELWLICGQRHSFAQEQITQQELPLYRYVLREKQSAVTQTLQETLKRLQIPSLPVVMEVGSTEAIINILNQGEYFSFLPKYIVQEHVKIGRLRHIPISGLVILRTLWIARHRDQVQHPVADAFIKIMRELK